MSPLVFILSCKVVKRDEKENVSLGIYLEPYLAWMLLDVRVSKVVKTQFIKKMSKPYDEKAHTSVVFTQPPPFSMDITSPPVWQGR